MSFPDVLLTELFALAQVSHTSHNVSAGTWWTNIPYGIVIHHQVGWDEVGFDGALEYVKTNSPIAPTYNCWFNWGDGHPHILTEEEANHAGEGDWRHIERIQAGERVDARPDLPRSIPSEHPEARILNGWTWGWSLEGPVPTTSLPGVERHPNAPGHSKAQIESLIRCCAVVCDALAWDPHVYIMAHKESAVPKGRKTDPGFDMNWFRGEVEAAMSLTPEAATFFQGMFDELKKQGWTTGSNSAKKMEYGDRLRNGLAARTGKGGNDGTGIANTLALKTEVQPGPAGPAGPAGPKGDTGPSPKSATFTY